MRSSGSETGVVDDNVFDQPRLRNTYTLSPWTLGTSPGDELVEDQPEPPPAGAAPLPRPAVRGGAPGGGPLDGGLAPALSRSSVA
jgi:hypothetical protein